MSATYFFRHQALGVAHDRPMASAPTGADLAKFAAEMDERFGEKHPKTGEPYWIKVIAVENGETRTVSGLCGGAQVSGAHADAHAAGHCPIREGELPARESVVIGPGDVGTISATSILGSGTVK